MDSFTLLVINKDFVYVIPIQQATFDKISFSSELWKFKEISTNVDNYLKSMNYERVSIKSH